ncbi:TetR/AcrR family transcriptional regulator [Cohnella endophytica]|uniref:TetR/AcrR family transcriptional regulator n=1 Tax=Cohnella endophytica TaxID=2419778 RepID=A0A494XPL7_9BACL|nr:TetR/AcrR family transcriptional regulator [Cohnella endophytica]RKP50079.1 TetR/AcrR family transcriptional regulator [Cohnella endophytica]
MSIRRERKDAIEHRKLILQTALQLFDKHGVQPVSMHQIAKTAGIGQATLYRRYAHKGDLCMDMLQEYAKQLTDEIDELLVSSQSLPALDRLSGIMNKWIDAIEEKFGLIVAMESKMSCEDERGNFFHTPMYRYFRDKMASIFAEIHATKEHAADPEMAAHALICSMSPIGYFHMKQEKGYSTEQIKEQFRRLCEQYLA